MPLPPSFGVMISWSLTQPAFTRQVPPHQLGLGMSQTALDRPPRHSGFPGRCWGPDLMERTSRASRVRFSSLENCITPGVSNFCRIHWHCSTSLMNMNSRPMCWQYVLCGGRGALHEEPGRRWAASGAGTGKAVPSLPLMHASSGVPDTPACAHLQTPYDLPQRKGVFGASNKSGCGQLELLIQVSLPQVVEGWKAHRAESRQQIGEREVRPR